MEPYLLHSTEESDLNPIKLSRGFIFNQTLLPYGSGDKDKLIKTYATNKE